MDDRRVPRYADLHQTDAERERAAELRKLLARVEAGRGEDRPLGADILNALDAPTLIGDPTACLDCTLNLAQAIGQDMLEVLGAAMRYAVAMAKEGKTITVEDVARIACSIALRVHVAKIEGAPA
jgi:hypothetical protein